MIYGSNQILNFLKLLESNRLTIHAYYRSDKANVLAGLKPKLIDEMQLKNNDRIIDEPFTYIKQSVGFKKNYPEVIEFINSIIFEAIEDGYIKNSLQSIM